MTEFFLGPIRDPNTKNLSITRASGILLVVAGIVFAFLHPDKPEMVASLIGGGGLSFLSRTKTTPGA